MKPGKVERYILEKIDVDGAMMSIIIDPVDYSSTEKAVETAMAADRAGVDLIAVGGSIGAQGKLLDNVVKAIKEQTQKPIALFPGNIGTVSPYADAIYFMSMLNSRNPYWITHAQTLAAPLIKSLHIEPLPMGYIVIEPGGTVGWVGDANAVPRNKAAVAASMAMAGEYMGQRIIFTDCGSNAPDHAPLEMISAVKKSITVPYLVAGGIKTVQQAGDVIKAGADWIQIGTAAEKSKDPERLLAEFVKTVKQEGKRKLKV